MNAQKLPGVIFRPAYFLPRFGNFAGENCGGVQLHITDRRAFRPVRTGLTLLYAVQDMSGDRFAFKEGARRPMIDLITGDDSVRVGRYSLEELLAAWDAEAREFKETAKGYYIYP
jgi:uncharacterized protein YbbC (DUF1343 family)